MQSYPDTYVVLVDTFQMMRSIVHCCYASCYNELEIFEKIADKHNIAIILVHHLGKMTNENVLNVISVSIGITGCTDGAFVLNKANHAQISSLYVTGRDIEKLDLSLKFNENCVWEIYEKPAKIEHPESQTQPPTPPVNTKEEIMAEIKEKSLILNCSQRDEKINSKPR